MLPVMHFAHGAPLPVGADNEINITIETPTHKYKLHRMLTYEDQYLFPIWTETSRFEKFQVRVLCGAECDSESGLCHWDTRHPPSTENMCAVKWGDGEWQATAVDIVELPFNDRVAHLKTLAGEKSSSAQIDAIDAAMKNEVIEKYKSELANLMCEARLMATPPSELLHWQALRQAYKRQPGDLDGKVKWLAVARMVIMGVRVAMEDPRNTKTDYTSKTIYAHLVRDLKMEPRLLGPTPAEPSKYEIRWATNLRMCAERGERDAKNKARGAKPT